MRSAPGTEGYTLLELLAVLAITTILAAIALPSLLSQANKAKESEARTYVGSVNRAQQVKLIESGSFGTLEELGSPIPTQTENYSYIVTVSESNATIIATPEIASLPPVSGVVQVQEIGTTGEFTTQSALCPRNTTPAIGCEQ